MTRRGDTARRNLHDRIFLDIYQLHILPIECLIKAMVYRRTHGAKRKTLWRQFFAHYGIVDLLGDFSIDELNRQIIGCLIEQNVVISQCKTESQSVPGLFENLLPDLRRVIQC